MLKNVFLLIQISLKVLKFYKLGYQRKGLALHYIGEFEKAIETYQ